MGCLNSTPALKKNSWRSKRNMIDIRIPYMPDMKLGRAYNLAMRTVNDWVLFMDHDILQLNPHYYEVCLGVTKKIGHKAGWITGVTNRIACEPQWCRTAPQNDDVMAHMRFAKQQWVKYGPTLLLIGNKKSGMNYNGKKFAGFSGFFMLTHKKAWEDVKGFKDGFLGVDNDYYEKLIKLGYETYLMPGIYVYHIYRQKTKWVEF